jgi:hypothetical protein
MAFSAVTRFLAKVFAAPKASQGPQKEPIAWGLLTSAPSRHPE